MVLFPYLSLLNWFPRIVVSRLWWMVDWPISRVLWSIARYVIQNVILFIKKAYWLLDASCFVFCISSFWSIFSDRIFMAQPSLFFFLQATQMQTKRGENAFFLVVGYCSCHSVFCSAPNRRITTETQHQNMCSVHMYEHFHPSFRVYQPVPSISHSVSSPPPHPLLGEGVWGGVPPVTPWRNGLQWQKGRWGWAGPGGGTSAETAGVACSPSQQHVVYKGPYVKQSRAPKFCVCIPKTIKSWWRRCGLKRCYKWSKGLTKAVPKRRWTCKNGPKTRNQAGVPISVQKHPQSCYCTTRHIQFTYGLVFVKCRFKGDTSKNTFSIPT